jgi:hypothetical protein
MNISAPNNRAEFRNSVTRSHGSGLNKEIGLLGQTQVTNATVPFHLSGHNVRLLCPRTSKIYRGKIETFRMHSEVGFG